MTDSVQALLSRLVQDGVDEGKRQHDALLAAARAEADKTLQDARREALELRRQAAADAALLQKRAEASARHAVRDLLLSLGDQIGGLVQRLVGARADQALSGDVVVKLLQRLMDAFVEHGRVTGPLDVHVSPELRKELTDGVMQELRARLEHGITLHVQPGLPRGFLIKMGHGGVTHDCTAKAAAEALVELVQPELAQIVLDAALFAEGGQA